jgi:hypothetical protein
MACIRKNMGRDMESHINWKDPEKPPVMNFARVMCFVLGGAGLIITGFMGVTESSLGAFLLLSLLFSLPIVMAFFARPRRWFVADVNTNTTGPWWRRTADQEYYLYGKTPFTRLSRVDYVLLAFVLLANIALVPVILPMLPRLGLLDGWFTPTCIVVCSTLGCAYFWQLAPTNRFPVIKLSLMAVVAVMLYFEGFKLDDRDAMISGVIGAQVFFWTLSRLVVSKYLAGPKSISTSSN